MSCRCHPTPQSSIHSIQSAQSQSFNPWDFKVATDPSIQFPISQFQYSTFISNINSRDRQLFFSSCFISCFTASLVHNANLNFNCFCVLSIKRRIILFSSIALSLLPAPFGLPAYLTLKLSFPYWYYTIIKIIYWWSNNGRGNKLIYSILNQYHIQYHYEDCFRH